MLKLFKQRYQLIQDEVDYALKNNRTTCFGCKYSRNRRRRNDFYRLVLKDWVINDKYSRCKYCKTKRKYL